MKTVQATIIVIRVIYQSLLSFILTRGGLNSLGFYSHGLRSQQPCSSSFSVSSNSAWAGGILGDVSEKFKLPGQGHISQSQCLLQDQYYHFPVPFDNRLPT